MNDVNVKMSIIVPVFNTKQYLCRCFNSICGQTLKEIEIILVDDGSYDGSGEICDQYSAKDARIHVIHKKNEGLVSARQAGLAAAVGNYIGFVDSDDWIEPDMYQTLYEIAISNGADIVAEGIINDIGNKTWKSFNLLPKGKYETVKKREKMYRSMLSCSDFFCMGIQPYLCNKLIRRELALLYMNKIPWEIRVGEDAAAVYPILAQADTTVLTDMAHYHYCHRSTSMMSRNRREEEEYENVVLLEHFLKKSFAEIGIYEVMREQLWRYTVNNIMTRAYGIFAETDKKSILFPFADISEDDSLIIYGAGAFGKAVYQYLMFKKGIKVKAWIDQRAAIYQNLGLDIKVLEDVDIGDTYKIIVAVLSKTAYENIRGELIRKGVESNQIKWIDMEKLWNLSMMKSIKLGKISM